MTIFKLAAAHSALTLMATTAPGARRAQAVPKMRVARSALKALVATVAALGATLAAAQRIELFDAQRFGGERLTLELAAADLADYGFKDRANSLVVRSGHWEVCERPQFRGTCLTLPAGRYETLPVALAARIGSARPLDSVGGSVGPSGGGGIGPGLPGLAAPKPIGPASVADDTAPLTLYRDAGFSGGSLQVGGALPNLGGFNDKASSLEIQRGRWQFCVNSDFGGPCLVLGPGRHALNGRFHDGISSLRRVIGPQDQPLPPGGGVLLYEDVDFNGRELLRLEATRNLEDFSFNDRVSSIEVLAGRWELCSNADHGGECLLFGPGRYRLDPALADRLSSLRPR